VPYALLRTVGRILRSSVIAPGAFEGGDDSADSKRQSPPHPGLASRPPSRRDVRIIQWFGPPAWHPARGPLPFSNSVETLRRVGLGGARPKGG
jgi:hypothetical protein